jgi:protein ImuB
VAIIQSIAQRRQVVDVSQQAQVRGVQRGMSAAEARALCANLLCIEQDLPGDLRTLDALGRWLIRFTPVVARGWDDADPDALPAVLFLDLTGSERLFKGIDRLVNLVHQSLAQLAIPAHMALAPTPGAAWALAATGGQVPVCINAASLDDAVAPLPVETLRLNETILANLHHLGLHCVGDVLALRRDQLPARFGSLLLKRLDQLTGALLEPLTQLVNEPPISARMEFDAPVESLEDIWLIFSQLLNQVVADLTRRQLGVRQLRLIFKPDRGWGRSAFKRTISLSRPHRNPTALLDLIRCETERVDCEHGFIRFQLDVPLYERVTESQSQLFDQRSVEEEIELDRLLQRLRVRLGEAAVIRPQWVESYLPERAWQPATDDAAPVAVILPSPPRPLTLFPTPIEIHVVSEPSDDRTGPPRQFTWRGDVHLLLHAVGPERIAGEWWRGHCHTRDYYDVQDQTGRRFWLFRVLHPRGDDAVVARWFLHGRFD